MKVVVQHLDTATKDQGRDEVRHLTEKIGKLESELGKLKIQLHKLEDRLAAQNKESQRRDQVFQRLRRALEQHDQR